MADPGAKEKETEILELQQEVKRLREVEQEYNDLSDLSATQPRPLAVIFCINYYVKRRNGFRKLIWKDLR
eukprot:SAG22_NODE_259_length_13477_cov_10.020407_3_plen_70_part_00